MSKDVYDRVGLSTYYCPKDNDYYISSNFNSESFATLEIVIAKCASGCQTDAVIEGVINSHYIKLALINSYFDFDDYEDPIKTYLEDLNIITLLPSTTKSLVYDVQHNLAELKENLFFNVFSETREFYSVGSRSSQSENFVFNYNAYVMMFFKLSQISDSYERSVFTLFDMFGLLGGVFGILSSFGGIMVSLISVKLFNNTLFSQLYQIKVKNKERNNCTTKLDSYVSNERDLQLEYRRSEIK